MSMRSVIRTWTQAKPIRLGQIFYRTRRSGSDKHYGRGSKEHRITYIMGCISAEKMNRNDDTRATFGKEETRLLFLRPLWHLPNIWLYGGLTVNKGTMAFGLWLPCPFNGRTRHKRYASGLECLLNGVKNCNNSLGNAIQCCCDPVWLWYSMWRC